MSVCYHSKELYNLIVKNTFKTMRNTVRQETTLYDWSLFKKTCCDWLNLNTCHRSTNQAREGLRNVMRNLIRIVYTKIGFISSKLE